MPCVLDERGRGSYWFPELPQLKGWVACQETQIVAIDDHRAGLAVVQRHPVTATCPKGRATVKQYVCDRALTGVQPRGAEGWLDPWCVTVQRHETQAACRAEWSKMPCATNQVPVPTPEQAAYQRHEIMGLTHFNMATFVEDGDPACNPTNWNVGVHSSHASLFDPTRLNISNWVENYRAVGAKHAVLTAKHGCGFLLWNTSTTLPNGTEYPFAVARSSYPSFQRDVIAEFSSTLGAAGLGYGYYYSTGNNYFLNRDGFKRIGNPLPGQVDLTDEQYNILVFEHVKELWTRFGSLFEIWFDHGVSADQDQQLAALLKQYQPQVVGFNGQGIMTSPIKWVGTESGLAGYPTWATGCSVAQGDPTANGYCPVGGDTYVQNGHWFWRPGFALRSVQQMVEVYHMTVGNNQVLELDFAIDDTGNVPSDASAVYHALGAWARACYGMPVANMSGNSSSSLTAARLTVDSAVASPVILAFAAFKPCPDP
ncbi:uncharacterized protein MONBRDRAFT_31183 [Monosiga brevicollis MX1]|uniref:alpha-L-fucosidase n=1 Tax=Monosiga brevicollis TaxID=81824 RepID=A9US80_MONBE|nr:uncharacterized protein MONBRDRAFT_31183 [Monosiga brevicollis MX1]EDQ91734.1 predicted protein [Monosiga brevicollis MX1]|eukprot:XP_001743020.1 hypothetical protein [Monosiga brevicollis MX1]